VTAVAIPVLSGPGIYEQIRAARSGIIRPFICEYAGESFARHPMLHGAPFLRKPFSAAVLADHVREALANVARVRSTDL
jgi:FixJ family two-component response regulator